MTVNHEIQFKEYLANEKHIALMMLERVKKFGAKTALMDKPYGTWEGTSWESFGQQIKMVAKALIEMGVKEKEMIGIFSQNKADWTIADIGILSTRAVSVPVYATNSAEETGYIVNDAEIRILFVNDQEQYDKALKVLKTSDFLQTIIVFDKTVTLESEKHSLYFQDFLESGNSPKNDQALEERLNSAGPDDLYTLIYTSGTTGPPKGTMISHKGALCALYGTGYPMPVGESDVSFSFLPLSHVFERTWTYFVLSRGAENHYCHDTSQIKEFLAEVRPHYMVSVPRVWEKIYGTIMEGVKNAPEKKQKIFKWASDIGGRYYPLKNKNASIGLGLKIKHFIAKKLVLGKIQEAVGGRAKFYHVGGAPFSSEIHEFFVNAGVRLGSGYGMTELFPICVCTPEDIGFGTSGKPIPLMNVRIADNGEIQAKSPSLMTGYWKRPDAFNESLTEDNWMKTGDIGEITPEGYVKITDRIKEIIITAGGKNISPQTIETSLKEDIYIEQAVAIGDNRKYISALIVPSFAVLEIYAKENGIDFSSHEDIVENSAIIDFYEKRISQCTRALGQVEKIKKFVLLPNELTQEAGELTPTSKLKRKNINENHNIIIESMYQ